MAAQTPAEGSAGLPQFEAEWFTSQLFWLAVSFALLYWLLSQALLPQIDGVMQARGKKIRSDIDAAAEANQAAQAELAVFERTLAEARSEARTLADQARLETEATRAQRSLEAEQRLSKRLAAVEERLAAGRPSRLEAAQAAGDEAARAIVAKLVPGAAV